MVWVSIEKRKPKITGYYFWKGKSNYGGRAYYCVENGFDFDDSIPANKVDDEYLFWLDEEDEIHNSQFTIIQSAHNS